MVHRYDGQRMKKYIFQGLLCLAFVAATGVSHAARPMSTDDANVVDAHACQLETWLKFNHGSTEYWAIPGCNFGYDIEWSLGGQVQWNDPEVPQARGYSRVFQVKKRWKPVGVGEWGISTTLGRGHNQWTDGTADLHHDRYVNVPMTYLFANGALLHVNVGAMQHLDLRQTHRTWGLGAEYPVNGRTYVIAETYAERTQGSRYQVGLRVWLKPQRLQLDTTYGNRRSWDAPSQSGWFTLGLRWLGEPLY